MPNHRRPPRSNSHGSHTTRLLAIAASLGLVGCMLFAQPVRRAYVWIAAADVQLPIDLFQQAEKRN
jgi:hypothetical protein